MGFHPIHRRQSHLLDSPLSAATSLLVLIGLLVRPLPLAAQPDDAERAERAEPQLEEPPAPQTLALIAKDGVELHCVYYPGQHGKQTIPIIMLHGWSGPVGEGSSRDLAPLAKRLQRAGHAVAVPDLRGHGNSTRIQNQNEDAPAIDRELFRRADLRDMMLDVEAVRSFLASQHNQGKLNLDLLCVVGFELGGVVALNWIHYDWSVPSFPALKQGQDVKAFVLVSPEQSFKGFTVKPALANPAIRQDLSALIIYGKRDPESEEGQRLYKTLRRARGAPPPDTDGTKANQLQELFLVELDTRLRGSKLVDVPALQLDHYIKQFVEQQLVPLRQTTEWRSREAP